MSDIDEEQASHSVSGVLRGPYRWLFLSNSATGIAGELRIVAQGWLILELGGSQTDVGMATGICFLPFLLGSDK